MANLTSLLKAIEPVPLGANVKSTFAPVVAIVLAVTTPNDKPANVNEVIPFRFGANAKEVFPGTAVGFVTTI